MALPIASTPILEGEDAINFLNIIEKDLKTPAKLTPTPKLEEAKKLIRKYANRDT